jgi:uncharacterized damage-inducible protein DinB
MTQPDVWLRGPIEGIDPLLQPVAHALVQAREDVERVAAGLGDEALRRRPGSAASAGWHLRHLIGATDRLLTYARGERLSDVQRAWLRSESDDGLAMSAAALVARFGEVVEAGLAQLRSTPAATLPTRRTIGRDELPSTVIGCLYHAAEHASRHVGQLITTVKAAS